MAAKTALGSAPHVVGEAERRDRGNRRAVRQPDLPPDQRQAQAPEVDPERPARVDGVAKLSGAVQEAVQIAARWAMAQRQVDLVHPETGACGIDGHPHLTAEPGCDGKAGGARSRSQDALAGERLTSLDAAEQLDQVPRHALRDAEASTDALGEGGHAEVGVTV